MHFNGAALNIDMKVQLKFHLSGDTSGTRLNSWPI